MASSSTPERIRLALGVTDLLDYFTPNIFSATMVKQGKPAPDLFLYAAMQMGVSPKDCVVIEDSVSGVKAAKAAGMTAIGFTGGSHVDSVTHGDKLTAAGVDLHFNDMSELPELLGLSY